jgi:two-component system sensor histidine kinase DesK
MAPEPGLTLDGAGRSVASMVWTSATDREAPWFKRLIDVRRPWLWLAYLPLFGATWIGRPPNALELVVSALGVLTFLALYIYASRLRGRALIAPSILVLLLAFAMIPFRGNWTVLAIYATAIAAELRPAREGWRLVFAVTAASVAVALLTGMVWYFVIMFGVFEIMVAIGKISGMNLGEKHADLLLAQEEVRRLSREAERERIARDLHDLLGRTLTLIALKADLAVKLSARDPAAAEREMKDIADAARGGLSDVRAAVAGMNDAGLARELEASRSALRAAQIGCEIVGEDLAERAANGAVLAMALREAVTNVIRHAGATQCTIVLGEEDGGVSVTVIDDGQGGRFREGAGLAGMRARLAAAGGRLSIHVDGSGTRIAAAIPATAQ